MYAADLDRNRKHVSGTATQSRHESRGVQQPRGTERGTELARMSPHSKQARGRKRVRGASHIKRTRG